jgi:hypothetical protein
VYPGAGGWPGNSNLNFAPGQASTNLVQATVGSNGKVAFANGSAGGVDLVADVLGWISDTPSGAAGRLRPLPPSRLLDTRGGQSLRAGEAFPLTLPVAGHGGVPATGVAAVVLNVTVTNPSESGFVAAYPAGGTWPGNSNVNFTARQTVPNRVIAKLGAGGAVSFVSSAPADLVVDVGGWYTDSSDPAATGGAYTAIVPSRLLDTRKGIGAIGPGGVHRLVVAGAGGSPSAGVTAVALNVTATDVTAPTFIAAYPAAAGWQVTSDLNASPGVTATNLVIVKVGAGGAIDLANETGSVDLVVDLAGWYG